MPNSISTLGYFDEAINAISDYQRKYPNSQRTENIDEILTVAYLNAKNYDVALRHIESMKTRSATINKAYQQIAFYKGTELFNDGKFPEAIAMFDKSLTQSHSNAFVIKAHYWKGRSFFHRLPICRGIEQLRGCFSCRCPGRFNRIRRSKVWNWLRLFQRERLCQSPGSFQVLYR
ncbi:MAG: hypothetical protein U5K79_00695 [Cyclobacteriaceae bacterium]|nr:hypothetical protein [Cyclobacteriaceae bacterium]